MASCKTVSIDVRAKSAQRVSIRSGKCSRYPPACYSNIPKEDTHELGRGREGIKEGSEGGDTKPTEVVTPMMEYGPKYRGE